MMYEYNDGRRNGGRYPCLYLAKGAEVRKFLGENIPGFVAIVAEKYRKAGIWSSTTYQLELAPGVRAIELLSPLHGTWGDQLQSWGAVAAELQLPVPVAQEIIREEYPKTAKRLDDLEAFAAEVEAEACDTEVVVVSFGSPTNRQIADGFWEQPKTALTSDGRRVTVAPSANGGWSQPQLVEPEGARILSVRRYPGMHGGHRCIEVAVPIAKGGEHNGKNL